MAVALHFNVTLLCTCVTAVEIYTVVQKVLSMVLFTIVILICASDSQTLNQLNQLLCKMIHCFEALKAAGQNGINATKTQPKD